MSAATANQSPVDLSLQTLIDTRFDIHKHRALSHKSGQDLPGQRLAARRGQGIEFLDLRQYTDGDDVRHIDWNVTARSREPYTRFYRQEQEQSAIVVVDLRSVMFTGSVCLRAVAAGRLAAATLWQAAHAGDRCAAMVISSQDIKVSRPLTGNNGVLQALELIATGYQRTIDTISTTRSSQKDQTLLSDAMKTVISNKSGNGNYFIFSGFDTDQDHHFNDELLAMAALRRVHAIFLLDKLELGDLPNGNYRFRHDGLFSIVRINATNRKKLGSTLDNIVREKQMMLENAGLATTTTNTSTETSDFLTLLQQRGWL